MTWHCTNFKPTETHCFCGCGFQITTNCQKAIQGVRDILQKWKDTGVIEEARIKVNSGARCEIYNKGIKNSAPNSYHKVGMALDLHFYSREYAFDLIHAIMLHNATCFDELRFNCIRIYPNFVHIDLRSYEQRQIVSAF